MSSRYPFVQVEKKDRKRKSVFPLLVVLVNQPILVFAAASPPSGWRARDIVIPSPVWEEPSTGGGDDDEEVLHVAS